ncbi:MAG: MlaD family protein [Nitrospirota bacterium]|nr:MlaD family protein [Nitrospirota bacterium]
MSKQANKVLIGAFVVGALALVIAGLLIFGSGKFFSPRAKFVMFFDGSVKGLQVGSPVTFRGVKIGDVTDIAMRFNPDDLSVRIPVYIEIDPKKFIPPANKDRRLSRSYKALIDRGLRARLELQSFVTGQLLIGLDFYPDKPARFEGTETEYPEIPTVPTSLEELTKSVQDLPLKEITENLNRVLAGLDRVVNSSDLQGSFAQLNQTLRGIDTVLKDIDSEVKPLASDIKTTSEAARSAFAQAEKTLVLREGVPGEVAAGLKETLAAARSAFNQTEKAASALGTVAAQNENVGYQLNRTLGEISSLARSLRALADYLERHPEALLRGKSPQKGE